MIKKASRTFIISAFTVLISFSGTAQINQDSINSIINSAVKTKVPDLCNQYAEKYLEADPEFSLFLAEKAFSKSVNENQKALSVLNMAEAYCLLGEKSKAFVNFEKSEEISLKIKNNKVAAKSIMGQGKLYYLSGNYDKAIKHFSDALKYLENNAPMQSLAFSHLGIIYKKKGDYQRALIYYNKALVIDRANTDLKNIAADLNNIGAVYKAQGNFETALDYYQKAFEIDRTLPLSSDLAVDYNNIGMVWYEKGNLEKAVSNFFTALEIYKKLGEKQMVSATLNNIGGIYDTWSKPQEALNYYLEAYKVDVEIDDKYNIALDLNNIGTSYMNLKKYDLAIDHYKKARSTFQQLGMRDAEASVINNIGGILSEIGQYKQALENFEEAYQIDVELNRKSEQASDLINIGHSLHKLKQFEKAIEKYNEALKLAGALNSLTLKMSIYNYLSILYEETGNYKKSLEAFRNYIGYKDSIFTQDANRQLSEYQAKFLTREKEHTIKLKNIELQKKALENKKQRQVIYFFIAGLALIILLIIQIYTSLRKGKKHEKQLSIEKAKTDELLLNIIPEKILPELKETGKVKPENFENVTVFFSDIVGFTNYSMKISPQELIDELNKIFTVFDEIMERHQCERIKTIGDAYMAVCGIPVKNPDHAENIMKASIEILNFMKERNKTSDHRLEIRIGINTGRVIGGMVGVKKYAYDVFGDTVNTASRAEHYSENMKINVTENVYHRLKDKFTFISREPIEVKGKGKMQMYFLDDQL